MLLNPLVKRALAWRAASFAAAFNVSSNDGFEELARAGFAVKPSRHGGWACAALHCSTLRAGPTVPTPAEQSKLLSRGESERKARAPCSYGYLSASSGQVALQRRAQAACCAWRYTKTADTSKAPSLR